jgi:hypothetical protein
VYKSEKISLFALILSLSLIGSARAVCPSGDLNGDCYVDMLDIQIFAEQWPVRQYQLHLDYLYI